MFRYLFALLLIVFSVFLTECDKEDDSGTKITSLKLELSKNRIVGDSIDYAKVTVTSQDGVNVIDLVKIYYRGAEFVGNNIRSAIPSQSTVYAMYNDIKSNEAALEVVEDRNLKFVKNVLMEQYTGTWCGWCPRAIFQISTLEKTDPYIVHVAHHLSDEMTYNLNMSLFQSFSFTGVPTVHADRNIVWQGNISDINKLHSPSRVGITLDVSGTAQMISAKVDVKFGYDFTEELKLSVYLLHDSLVSTQANYYNTDPASPWYQAGATMQNFIHRNVMMKSGTDMFGDVIPSSAIDIGSIYTKKVDFTSFTSNDLNKMVVVAFVTWGNGSKSGQVNNVAVARPGQKVEFRYSGN